MITLYTSGPRFGLPDASPFVVKAMMLLKMSGLDFVEKPMSFRQAPKGKIPYVQDGQTILGDSHFIARHLQQTYKVDFNAGYNAALLAKGWAIARMLEEHFYFLNVHDRWMNDNNFNRGPSQFFDEVPAPLRPLIRSMIRRRVRKMLTLQGLGRHTATERHILARGDLDCIEEVLGSNGYILGNNVSGTDASTFAFLASAEAPYFESEIGDDIRRRPALMNYIKRIRSQYFPEQRQ